MKFDPKIHHRNSIRLKGYDYSYEGSYFVTVCAMNRENIFGKIQNRKPILSNLGKIIEEEWHGLTQRFPETELDEYVIMPNHFHGIVHIVGAGFTSAPSSEPSSGFTSAPSSEPSSGFASAPSSEPSSGFASAQNYKKHTLGDIICAFKSLVFNRYYKIIKENNLDEVAKCWQRNYWERIIRDNQEYVNIQHYIAMNPERWSEDSDNLERLLARMTERKDKKT